MSAVQAPPTGGAWTDEEHNHIIEFLSRSIYEGKGRPWKQLVKAMTGKHSLEAWKARYKDYRPYFDSKIDDYMRKFFGKALILSKSPIYRTTPTTESTDQWRRFTETDGQTLTAHLAENDLDGSKRQWFRSVYKPLVIVSPGHSADDWQGHYRTYADYFDYQIQQYQKSHGLPITPGQTSLKGVKMPTYASLVPKTMSKRKSSQFSNHNSRSMPYIPRSKRLLARSNQSDTQNEASTDAGLSTRPRLKASTKHRVVRRVYVLVPGRRSNSGSSKSVSRKPGEQSTLTFSKSSEGSQRNLLENTELLDRDFSDSSHRLQFCHLRLLVYPGSDSEPSLVCIPCVDNDNFTAFDVSQSMFDLAEHLESQHPEFCKRILGLSEEERDALYQSIHGGKAVRE